MNEKQGLIPARLIARRHVAEGLAVFRIGLGEDLHFQPGQYATLWLTRAGETTARPYSIASSPSQPRELEFYINLVASGTMTTTLWSERALDALQRGEAGTSLGVTGPKGRFVLDRGDPRDLVFVASGTGLGPFMSMLRTLNEEYQGDPSSFAARRILVIHGASYPGNLGYHDELLSLCEATRKGPERGLAVAYLPTISRPQLSPGWTGLTGRAEALFDFGGEHATEAVRSTVALLRALLRPERQAVYVCGHPGTVDRVVRYLVPLGFRPGTDIRSERFYAAHPAR